MPGAHVSPLHAALREATRSAHHRLDHHALLAPLARPDLRPDQYGRALLGFHGLHARVEPAILAGLARHGLDFDYAERCKLDCLRQDLATLGLAVPDTAVDLADPDSPGAVIGLLYTVEGSTLGGRFLARRIGERPGPALPLRFLSGYGDATEPRWQAFWQFADRQHGPGIEADAVAAAVTAFTAFAAFLDHLADPPG